ncbi:MAG: hypothetical protein ILP19_02895, partial [Oscillospiraceae bacterium]|nr:hypothetical protein [Oscillospiraceae bacterium]
LSAKQEKIANAILEGLSQAGILSSLDETILALAAFSIDGMGYSHTQIFRIHNKALEKMVLNGTCVISISPQF